jgi:hypothetical protein
MNKIRLFDPEVTKPDDYRHRYPELERTVEFAELSAQGLIFVWWYSNPTSPLVMDFPDDNDRVIEALKRSKYNPSRAERENILRLQFDTILAVAIMKMSNFDPGIRFRSYKIVRTVFDEYEKLIKRGPSVVAPSENDNNEDDEDASGYKSFAGKADKNPYFIDRYVITSARIVEALPSLLNKLEEGFGIIDVSGNEVAEEGGVSSLRDWHRGKENKET